MRTRQTSHAFAEHEKKICENVNAVRAFRPISQRGVKNKPNYLFSSEILTACAGCASCLCGRKTQILIYFASATFLFHEMRLAPMCHLVIWSYQCFVVIFVRPKNVFRDSVVRQMATEWFSWHAATASTFFERNTHLPDLVVVCHSQPANIESDLVFISPCR